MQSNMIDPAEWLNNCKGTQPFLDELKVRAVDSIDVFDQNLWQKTEQEELLFQMIKNKKIQQIEQVIEKSNAITYMRLLAKRIESFLWDEGSAELEGTDLYLVLDILRRSRHYPILLKALLGEYKKQAKFNTYCEYTDFTQIVVEAKEEQIRATKEQRQPTSHSLSFIGSTSVLKAFIMTANVVKSKQMIEDRNRYYVDYHTLYKMPGIDGMTNTTSLARMIALLLCTVSDSLWQVIMKIKSNGEFVEESIVPANETIEKYTNSLSSTTRSKSTGSSTSKPSERSAYTAQQLVAQINRYSTPINVDEISEDELHNAAIVFAKRNSVPIVIKLATVRDLYESLPVEVHALKLLSTHTEFVKLTKTYEVPQANTALRWKGLTSATSQNRTMYPNTQQ